MDSSRLPRDDRSHWIAALVVSFLALLALVLVPAFLARRQAALERELAVFSQARLLFPEIQLVQSQEMMRIEQYVNSADSSFLALYQNEVSRESELLADFGRVISGMPPTYRVELSQVESLTNDWRLLHSGLVGEGPLATDPVSFRESMDDDRARFESVQTALRAFESQVIFDEISASSGLGRLRTWQFWVTLGAIGLAVLGACSMAFVGLRLQDLARDETQRRLETVEARRDIRSILGGTADGLIGVDLEGKCTFLNQAGSRLLGYSQSELYGEPVHRRIHHTKADGGEHSEQDCPVHVALDSGETVRVPDDVLWRKDGTSFPVQLIVSPMTDGLEVRGVVLTFTDMTEMRAAEDALREAVQARDEVLAVVSHDLRNPVGTIAAAAELLSEPEIPAERQAENLDIIQRSADRINRLIQDLLDVAQIEAGRLSVRSAALDLSEVIEDVVSQARLQASFKNIHVASEVPESLPSVEADRDRVLQVLANLIDNALKFTPDGGSVTVSASRALEGVSIAVADTGPGIAPEQRDHLFDRFWKGHRASGAGLGLAIVKGILQAHGADIQVETEVGSGSVFSFTLRLAD